MHIIKLHQITHTHRPNARIFVLILFSFKANYSEKERGTKKNTHTHFLHMASPLRSPWPASTGQRGAPGLLPLPIRMQHPPLPSAPVNLTPAHSSIPNNLYFNPRSAVTVNPFLHLPFASSLELPDPALLAAAASSVGLAPVPFPHPPPNAQPAALYSVPIPPPSYPMGNTFSFQQSASFSSPFSTPSSSIPTFPFGLTLSSPPPLQSTTISHSFPTASTFDADSARQSSEAFIREFESRHHNAPIVIASKTTIFLRLHRILGLIKVSRNAYIYTYI